jgi:hypothetical protein
LRSRNEISTSGSPVTASQSIQLNTSTAQKSPLTALAGSQLTRTSMPSTGDLGSGGILVAFALAPMMNLLILLSRLATKDVPYFDLQVSDLNTLYAPF